MGLARSLRLRLALCSWMWLLRLRLGLRLVVVLVWYLLAILGSPHVDTRRKTWWVEESARQVCLRKRPCFREIRQMASQSQAQTF